VLSDGVNAATTAKSESDKHLPQWGTGTPHAMTHREDNETSVLNAYRHWTARYKNGESAELTVETRLFWHYVAFNQERSGFMPNVGDRNNTAHFYICKKNREAFLSLIFRFLIFKPSG